MKSLLIPLAACAALSGCVGYGGVGYADPYYGAYGGSSSYGYAPGYYQAQPNVYIGGSYYETRPDYRNDGRRGGRGDRDGDGISNRRDRDRDGDGVRNRDDARPDNPRRR